MANSETWGIMDPADSADALAIARKKAYAQALLQQSMEQQPSNQMAGRVVVPVSPWQGAAQLGNAYLASKLGGQADTQEADLKQREYSRQMALADALDKGDRRAATMVNPKAAAENVLKPVNEPESVREFNFAKANGFAGSYMDWVKAKKEKEETPSSNVKDYQFAKAQGYKGSFKDWMGDVSAAKAGGAAGAKADVANTNAMPAIVDNANFMSSTIDKFLSHPGRPALYGWQGIGGLRAKVPESEAADAKGVLDEITGQTFLQAYGALRGGGQITEIEGQKATDAISRLKNTAMSDEKAVEAAKELKAIVDIGRQRALNLAKGVKQPTTPNASAPSITPEQARAELARRKAAKK